MNRPQTPFASPLTWTLTVVLGLLALPQPGHAQPPQPPRDAQVYTVTLYPAAAPVPALKYQLLPFSSELQPGNAVQGYYRAFSPEWWGFISRDPKLYEKEERAAKQTLAEFKNNKELEFVKESSMLKEVDRAARHTYAEWNFLPRLREDGIDMLLPDIQSFRQLANFLRHRARYELAAGNYAKATATISTNLAMARHVNESGTLISHLVSIAIVSGTLGNVREAIQQPDAPNLYWALTDLPTPFLDLRRALEGERELILGTLPELRDLLAGKVDLVSDKQLRQRLNRILPVFGGTDNLADPNTGKQTPLNLIAWTMVNYPSAKKTLLADGLDPATVEKFSALQACLLVELRNYRRAQDDIFKWTNLPYPQAIKGLREVTRQLDQEHGPNFMLLARTLLPAIEKIVYARAQLERQFAMLRVIEALRLHAAANNGQWPGSLEAITVVPVPTDPLTGKAFEYTRQGDSATLRAGPLPGEAPNVANTIRYEIFFKQKQ